MLFSEYTNQFWASERITRQIISYFVSFLSKQKKLLFITFFLFNIYQTLLFILSKIKLLFSLSLPFVHQLLISALVICFHTFFCPFFFLPHFFIKVCHIKIPNRFPNFSAFLFLTRN